MWKWAALFCDYCKSEIDASVLICYKADWVLAKGFFRQEGIRWRLASSPLVLYKSVGGECHVWLWNDFFVLHDNLLGIGRDRTRSQFRLQEVEVSRHPSRIWLAAANPFALTEGKKPYQKRHPFLPLLYHIESKLSTNSFNSIWKNQMAGTFWFVNAK